MVVRVHENGVTLIQTGEVTDRQTDAPGVDSIDARRRLRPGAEAVRLRLMYGRPDLLKHLSQQLMWCHAAALGVEGRLYANVLIDFRLQLELQ